MPEGAAAEARGDHVTLAAGPPREVHVELEEAHALLLVLLLLRELEDALSIGGVPAEGAAQLGVPWPAQPLVEEGLE